MGPVRMISSGHELTTDYDEKTLHELGFKDMQVPPLPSLSTLWLFYHCAENAKSLFFHLTFDGQKLVSARKSKTVNCRLI